MSYDDVNPEWVTKSVNIKVTDQDSTILRGYLAILDYEVVEGDKDFLCHAEQVRGATHQHS